jgi:hypothetical protein
MTTIGKILKADTRKFVFGCRVNKSDVPIFGSLVKTNLQYRNATLYGLIYNIEVQDDGTTKLLSVADDVRDEDIEWQRDRRVPVEVTVLSVGYRDTFEGQTRLRHALPPQPPITLDLVTECDDAEMQAFTSRLDFFRLILDCNDAPCDELLAASIRLAADARPEGQREFFRVSCGHELARLMAKDAMRLENLLRRIAY